MRPAVPAPHEDPPRVWWDPVHRALVVDDVGRPWSDPDREVVLEHWPFIDDSPTDGRGLALPLLSPVSTSPPDVETA